MCNRYSLFFCYSSGDILRSDAVPERMPDCIFYRSLWWDKGEFNEKAKWNEVTLPYVLATGITLEDYENRVDKFNIRGCWEWSNWKVIIYEFPSEPHEVGIGAITKEILESCRNANRTDAEIYSYGSTRTQADRSAKEADDSFRPEKLAATYPNGSDGKARPWPNLIVEVAYSETIDHVTEKVRDYWLRPNRAHDVIVVKIDPVQQGQIPSRMKAWHYCVTDRRTRNALPVRTEFEFGTKNANGTPLNIQQGACVINISRSCLYHDLRPPAQIPQNVPDPIALDFFFIQRAILRALS